MLYYLRDDIEFLRRHAEQGKNGLICKTSGKIINYRLIERLVLDGNTEGRLVKVMHSWCKGCAKRSDVPSQEKLSGTKINMDQLVLLC